MLFHSSEFLFGFFPVVYVVYAVLARCGNLKGVLYWLTLSSLFFYAWWNPPYLLLVIFSILFNFAIGRAVCPSSGLEKLRVGVLLGGLAANILTLGYFKYANFFVGNINYFFSLTWDFDKVILPLAISFFTFTQIAYLVDAFRGETKRYTLLEYSFFVSFFPHLIAGPIVLHKEIMPQVHRPGAFDFCWKNFRLGFAIFLIGLFKKIVLADGCGDLAAPVFRSVAEGRSLDVSTAWIGVLGYTFQIYFDFSGYSDMAIGLARFFGILLPLNFASPYRATSIVEFWRRWHISLSRFLKQYLYIPLGGNRRGIFLRYFNLFITMLLGGLWHGAGATFLIWGAIHGVCLMINHGFVSLVRGTDFHKISESVFMKIVGWGLTMGAVIIGWIFFRSHDFHSANRLLWMLAGNIDSGTVVATHALGESFTDGNPAAWLFGMLLICLFLPNTQEYFACYRSALDGPGIPERRRAFHWHPTFLHGAAAGVLLFFTLKKYFQLVPSEFLYFNF